MKKLFLIATIIPMFGCSPAETNPNQSSVSTVAEEEKKTNYYKDEKKRNVTNLNYRQANMNAPVQKNRGTYHPPKKDSVILDVPLIKQNPELKYGCEVTSMAMMLQFAGVKTTKMELYSMIAKDPDPLIKSAKGDIIRWGNPADGFVGDMTGKHAGYAAFDQPMINLINKKLPGRAVNLTGMPFDKILQHVSNGYPVTVWTTGDYRLPDRWEGWYHGDDYIRTPLDLHVVVLVGYDKGNVYLNDPLSGRKQVKVNKERFISSWKALKSRAVSYK